MSFGTNVVILVGHIGTKPKKRKYKDNVGATFLAATRQMDKKKGLKIELSYVPVEAWGSLATMILEATRGDGVHIEGSLRSRIIENKGKPNQLYNWILADKILMIDYTSISKGRKWKVTDAEWTQKMSEDEFYDNFPKLGD